MVWVMKMETNHPSLHALTAIQTNLPMKEAYTLDELAHATGRSRPTAYRYLTELEQNGFVIAYHRGAFTLRDSVFLPPTIIPHILPSLHALKQAKRFRLHNGKSGVNKAKKLLSELGGMSTLDYAAHEITGYQTPDTFYFYPDLFERAVQLLRANNYVESPKGKVVLLPRFGDFSKPILRVFYDSLALGGRGIIDAIAISRRYPDITKSSGYLDLLLNLARKVEQDTRGADKIGQHTR
jgi:hypothetical protein